MGIVPADRLGKIEFYEAHGAPWASNAVAIGLTAAQVTALDALTKAARTAYNAAEVARQAAKAATQNFYDKVNAMHSGPGAGSDLISIIKTTAQTKNDPNVYVLAQIPSPATPAPTPPPGTPFDFTVGLLQNGAVQLKWKCPNPTRTAGTIYEVKRSIGGGTSAAFVFVGATGSRTFTDETIPAGSAAVTYQITAVRSTSRGNPSQFTVHFGTGGAGFVGGEISRIDSVEGGSSGESTVKLAA